MITTWSSGPADDGMSEAILTDLGDAVRRHPWWQARARLMLALLRRARVLPPARVLDAGCGWGLNLAALERVGYQVAGLDISRRCLHRLERPGRDLIEADITRPLPEAVVPYGAVVALDVIEHLDDDRGAVGRLVRLTRPGGVLVVSVPALPRLHSEFDDIQGHRRRYLPHTLRAAFAGSGARIESLFWWGSWMVPVLMFQRKLPRAAAGESPAEVYRHYLAVPPWPFSAALRLAFTLDEAWALHGTPPVGTSLFAVARRDG
jgi:SAM-dependent methyltransferase